MDAVCHLYNPLVIFRLLTLFHCYSIVIITLEHSYNVVTVLYYIRMFL